MAKVKKGDDLDVRDPEWFSEPFSSLWMYTVLEGWAGGAPIIRSAIWTIFCSLLISDFLAESNQTVIEVHRADWMTAELNCFCSSCGRLNNFCWAAWVDVSVSLQILRDDGSQELECLHCSHSAIYDGERGECREVSPEDHDHLQCFEHVELQVV